MARRNRKKYASGHTRLLVKARLSPAARREKLFRGGLTILAIVLGAGVIIGCWFGAGRLIERLFCQNEAFTIQTINVQSARLQPAYIKRRARVSEGMNLFAVDIVEKCALLEELSAVKSVRISRVLPDTLRIKVTERVPVARLRRRGYNMYVDPDGYVLGEQYRVDGLPCIEGYRARKLAPGDQISDPRVLEALALLALCEEPRFDGLRIVRFYVARRDYLLFYLQDGCKVEFQAADTPERERKLKDLALTLVSPEHEGKKLAWINMRVDRNYPYQYR